MCVGSEYSCCFDPIYMDGWVECPRVVPAYKAPPPEIKAEEKGSGEPFLTPRVVLEAS